MAKDLEIGTPLLNSKGAKELTPWQKFCKEDKNIEFAKDFEVSFRAATTVLFMALPFLLPKSAVTTLLPWNDAGVLQQSQREGFYSTVTVAMFLFAFCKDLGTTVNAAVTGSFGVASAACAIWILYGVYPESYLGDSPDWLWYVALCYGGIFIFVMLWLNLNANSCIFGITSFVWYLMAFLDPQQPTGFAKGFEVRFTGTAGKEFVASCIGGAIACLVMCFPYKILAIDKAVTGVRSTGMATISGWSAMTDFVTSTPDDFVAAQIKHDISFIQGKINEISANVATAWWECFGYGKIQRQRELMSNIQTFLSDIHNLLFATLSICTEDKDINESFMQELKPAMTEILSAVEDVLHKIIHSIETGTLTDVDRQDLKSICQSDSQDMEPGVLYKLIVKFTEEFRVAKGKDKEMQGKLFHESFMSENAYCLSLCSLARSVADFGFTLADKKWEGNGKDGFLGWKSLFCMFDERVLYKDPDHVSFVLRNWVTICLCFLIGYGPITDFGAAHPKNQYKAGLASLAGVLLAKGLGSPMSKNLSRLQGVILGTVVGFLLYTLLASTCWRAVLGVQVPVGVVGLGGVLFFFVWTTFFFAMNSKTNAYMAFLLMYNTTMQMIVGCDAENPEVFLRPIVLDVMIVIIIMTVVDAWFETHKASTLANHEIIAAFKIISKQTVHLFDSEKITSPIGGGKLSGCLAKAEAYGDFAETEARWHRTPWRKETFHLALKAAHQLRYLLHGMHIVAHVHGNEIAEARKDFKSKPLCESLRMEAVQRHLLHQPERRLGQVIQLLSILDHDKEGPCTEFDESQYQINKEFRNYHNETLKLALAEAEEKTIISCFEGNHRQEDLRAGQAAAKSLELDHVCQITYELAAGRTMVRMVRELMNNIIRLG